MTQRCAGSSSLVARAAADSRTATPTCSISTPWPGRNPHRRRPSRLLPLQGVVRCTRWISPFLSASSPWDPSSTDTTNDRFFSMQSSRIPRLRWEGCHWGTLRCLGACSLIASSVCLPGPAWCPLPCSLARSLGGSLPLEAMLLYPP
jgi:hypothetical protein